MNQNYMNGLNNPSYIESQSTYPPYTNIPSYVAGNTLATNTNTNVIPQYAENLFSMNRGKKVTAYFSYPDSLEARDRTFTGTILESGRDYLLLRDNQGKILLLWLVYINYAVFDEEISY